MSNPDLNHCIVTSPRLITLRWGLLLTAARLMLDGLQPLSPPLHLVVGGEVGTTSPPLLEVTSSESVAPDSG